MIDPHAEDIAAVLASPRNAGEKATALHQLYDIAATRDQGDAFVLALIGELLVAVARPRRAGAQADDQGIRVGGTYTPKPPAQTTSEKNSPKPPAKND